MEKRPPSNKLQRKSGTLYIASIVVLIILSVAIVSRLFNVGRWHVNSPEIVIAMIAMLVIKASIEFTEDSLTRERGILAATYYSSMILFFVGFVTPTFIANVLCIIGIGAQIIGLVTARAFVAKQ